MSIAVRGDAGASNQVDRARAFRQLHVKGSPLVLYNVWDAGSAQAVQEAGAAALATSSWAVAAAQGYEDGQAMPLEFVERILERIASSVEVPLSADFEGGYGEDGATVAANVARLFDLGIIGMNFEDRRVSGEGLYGIDEQCGRIAAIRKVADERGLAAFINARTDLFFGDCSATASLMAEAKERAAAYEQAGADGFFVPGLSEAQFISEICRASRLPVNVMVMDDVPSNVVLSELGVARISYGASPYATTMQSLQNAAKTLHAGITHMGDRPVAS